MRIYIIFVFFILSFSSCKVGEKKQVGKNDYNVTRLKTKSSKMVVSAITGKYMMQDSSVIKIFALMQISNVPEEYSNEDINKVFRMQWSLQSEYGIREKIKSGKLSFVENVVERKGNEFKVVFEVPKPKDIDAGVLILDVIDIDAAVKYTNDLPIDFKATKIDTRFNIFDTPGSEFPEFQTYLVAGKPFTIKSLKPSDEKLYLKQYRNLAKPALSPMSASRRDIGEEFEAVNTKEIKSGELITINEPGVYVLTQESDFHADGYGFLVVEDRFPRQTYADELKQSLVYMSTPKEIEEFQNNTNTKEALDLYFLNVAKGNQTMAKQIIKTYYKRVADANKLFSTFKEGWKTDKGMVYIIMGPPSRVQRNRQREVWLYSQTQNNSEIIFTFYRKSNAFSDQTFELVRYPEYSSFWYPYVEAWRTGNVVE